MGLKTHMPIKEYTAGKLITALAGGTGAAIAMAVLIPKSKAEAFLRGYVGLATPVISTDMIINRLGLPHDTDTVIFVAAAVGFGAWFTLGAAARSLERIRQIGLIQAWEELKGWRR